MARGIEMISMAKRKGPLAPVVVRFGSTVCSGQSFDFLSQRVINFIHGRGSQLKVDKSVQE